MGDKSVIGLAGKANESAKWDKWHTSPQNNHGRRPPPPLLAFFHWFVLGRQG